MDPTTIADPALASASVFAASGPNQIWLFVVSLLGSVVSTAAMLWKTSRDQKFALDKATQDQAHTKTMLELTHKLDMADRAAKADAAMSAATIAAGAVRERLATDAALVQTRVYESGLRVADRLGEQERTVKAQLEVQTETVKKQIDTVGDIVKREAEVVLGAKTAELEAALDVSTNMQVAKADARAVTLMEAIEGAKHFTAERADAAYHEANSVNVKLEKANARIEELYEIVTKLLSAVMPPRGGGGGGAGTKAAVKTAQAEVEAVEAKHAA